MENIFYQKDVDFFIEKIKNNQHFKYARYNDGELTAIIGKTPNKSNCDGHIYFPEMSLELKNSLLNYKFENEYYLESYVYWYNLLPHIKNEVDSLKRHNNELMFIDDDFIRMSHENNPDKFIEILEVLKKKKIVIVGAPYLGALKKYFTFKHIEIPLKNCYLSKNNIIQSIENFNKESIDNIYLFSASMATNVIIDYFKLDNNNTYIDWGSVWDTFFVSEQYSFLKKRTTSSHEKFKLIYKNYLL